MDDIPENTWNAIGTCFEAIELKSAFAPPELLMYAALDPVAVETLPCPALKFISRHQRYFLSRSELILRRPMAVGS